MSSDGGLLLLREASLRLSLFERFGDCFTDHRQPHRVEHTVPELLAQRVMAIACGYEDLNDHDRLRDDALLSLAVGKTDPLGVTRPRARDAGRALASSATLNRLERTPAVLDGTRADWKITHDPAAIESLFVEVFLDAHATPPEEIVLDLDATDDAVHGDQEGRFFHGYYDKYCFLPLYIFCGEHLLTALLRPSNIDGAAGALEEVQRIVEQVRQRWPDTRIILRADSGFARTALMTWCEATDGVDYVIGLSRNNRLQKMVSQELDAMVDLEKKSGHPERCYKELRYQTLKSWDRERRVVAKAEATGGKRNPRFVVTSLPIERLSTRALYADFYCARGDMENRIKEQQLGLFADRTSAHTMRANQLRVWFASMAYVLLHHVRRVGLRKTAWARAQVWNLRARLLKIAALVRVSVRRIKVSLPSVFPLQEVFAEALARLREPAVNPT